MTSLAVCLKKQAISNFQAVTIGKSTDLMLNIDMTDDDDDERIAKKIQKQPLKPIPSYNHK